MLRWTARLQFRLVAAILWMTLTVGALASIGCDAGGLASGDPMPSQHAKTYAGDYPIRAVCTTGMVADLVRTVGGPQVEVVQLMGEGIDPHLYNASPGDVSAMNSADLIFYSGLHLEGKLGSLLERVGRRKPTIAVAEGIDKQLLLATPEGVVDPHLWFDASLWRQALDRVTGTLVKFDPGHESEYRARGEEYGKQLDQLHAEAKQRLSAIPKSQRLLVTAHDAFEYLGRAYDIEVRGIQGISTDSEAGVHEVNELVDLLVDRKVKAVFVETTVSNRNLKALIAGCRARGHEVVIGGELYSDAMGKPGTPEGTYIGMLRHNIETIAGALE